MRHYRVGTVTAVAATLVLLVGSAAGQESGATIRTYQGLLYKVADVSLEASYTIGEPKEKEENSSQRFQSTINLTSTSAATSGAEPSAAGGAGAEKDAKLLRGHSRLNEITVSKEGVETRIPLEQIQAVRFARNGVAAGRYLPPYISHYRYAASVRLIGGALVEADYVNMGGTMVRGSTPGGQVDIPWEEVEQINFER